MNKEYTSLVNRSPERIMVDSLDSNYVYEYSNLKLNIKDLITKYGNDLEIEIGTESDCDYGSHSSKTIILYKTKRLETDAEFDKRQKDIIKDLENEAKHKLKYIKFLENKKISDEKTRLELEKKERMLFERLRSKYG